MAVVPFLVGCDSPHAITSPPAASLAEVPKPATKWVVTSTKNDLTGEPEVFADNAASRRVNMVIRRRGKKLECYINTDEFFETVQNMHTRKSPVSYRFDDGAIVRQAWDISADNTALFYPGNPRPFLDKIRQSRRLVVRFEPADTIPQSATFDVSNFPVEILR